MRLNPDAVSRLGLLFGVLIIQATYTANLAAFLVKSKTQNHGPTSMVELQERDLTVNLDNGPHASVRIASG